MPLLRFIIVVILAPFGQNGMLTGHVYRDTDQQTNRLFDEWKQCYPVESLEPAEANGDAPKLPAMVEVIVGTSYSGHDNP